MDTRASLFVAGTPVWVAEQDKSGQWHVHSKPIEQVKAGEYVIARNETTGVTDYKKVLRTTVLHADVTVSVTMADKKTGRVVETITSSREHPFYVAGKGFVPAGALAIGNSIVTRAGPALIVKSVKWNRRPDGYDVYNFVVDDFHSYFVGTVNGGAWVHNPGEICAAEKLGDLTGQDLSTIEGKLAEAGFVESALKDGSTSSYRTFKHPDGSMVSLDTANEVAKINGPLRWAADKSRKYRPRIGPHNQPYVKDL